jgi:hypothetical protein
VNALRIRVLESFPHIRRVQQGLGGDAADQQAGAAESRIFLNHGHFEAILARAYGRRISTGTAPEDDYVICHGLSLDGFSFSVAGGLTTPQKKRQNCFVGAARVTLSTARPVISVNGVSREESCGHWAGLIRSVCGTTNPRDDVVLVNCARRFPVTAIALVDACIEARVYYRVFKRPFEEYLKTKL